MSKEVKDPKDAASRLAKPGVVVELVKGDQWVDDLSGISLYRGFYHMASKEEMENDSKARELGYIKSEKEPAPTAEIPKGKDLTRVEKALRLGYLKVYDPDNPTVYVEHRDRVKGKLKYAPKSAKGYTYIDEDDNKIEKLLDLPLTKFKDEIVKFKSTSLLERIYEAEFGGRNRSARARKEYVEIIKSHMDSGKVGGVGRIISKPEGKVKVNVLPKRTVAEVQKTE